mgnify:CR=1 FL=1
MADRNDDLKAAVSVTEMARMLGMSRSRFYELIQEGVFLPPIHDVETRRPFFPPKIQMANLEIRARNLGANQRPILFYARRSGSQDRKEQRPSKFASGLQPKQSVDPDLVDDLADLGIEGVTDAQVRSAIRICFPKGKTGVEESEVLRAIYRHLKCRDSEHNS